MTSKPTVFAVHALALLATIADTHAPAIRGDYADITVSFFATTRRCAAALGANRPGPRALL